MVLWECGDAADSFMFTFELADVASSHLPQNDLGPEGIESKSLVICDTFPNPSNMIIGSDIKNNSQGLVQLSRNQLAHTEGTSSVALPRINW